MASVMVVDDEKSIRLTLSEFLKDAGYNVHVAEDAASAVNILNQNEIDVVVTDILLPDVNGTNLILTIRSHNPLIKVILITGEPNVDSLAIGLRAGAFDYLSKPLRKNEILSSVKKAARMKFLDDENVHLAEENRRYQEMLEEMVDDRTRHIANLSRRIIQVQEEERSRISRELHDDLGQSLLALKLNLQSLFGKLNDISQPLRHEFEGVLKYLNSIIVRSREISHNLSPIGLASLGLPGAIRELVDTFNRTTSLQIEINLDALENFFPQNWDINVYRIVQESLTNIIKHSGATHASIIVSRNTDHLSITIRDNGSGFSITNTELVEDHEKKSDGDGMGLYIMKKRVDLLGGKFTVNSRKNQGTEVVIELPGNNIDLQNRTGG